MAGNSRPGHRLTPAEVRRRVRASCRAQGVGFKIRDPQVIALAVEMLGPYIDRSQRKGVPPP